MADEAENPAPRKQLTQALGAAFGASGRDRDDVYHLVVAELRRVAADAMRRHQTCPAPQVTQLISEVWLRMAERAPRAWSSRQHFVGWAAKVVRSILVDQARAERALKRGGGQRPEPLTDTIAGPDAPAADILALDEALTELAQVDPKGAGIVELCYFGGLSQREAGALLGIDESTVKRRWRMARGWLQARIGDG